MKAVLKASIIIIMISSTACSRFKENWIIHYVVDGDGLHFPTALTIDDKGNVYVTGYSSYKDTTKTYTLEQYYTIKYSPQGEEIWSARYLDTLMPHSFPAAITTDVKGNVYVTGSSWRNQIFSQYTAIKYDSQGHEQWVSHYTSSEINVDEATAITVDNRGYVYVTGRSWDSTSWYADYGDYVYNHYDIVTVKLDPKGAFEWVTRYRSPGNVGVEMYASDISTDDEVKDIAADNEGNVYVLTNSYSDSTWFDYTVIKYDAFGNEKWVVHYTGPGIDMDMAEALVLDKKGNVYVTGTSKDSTLHKVHTTVKFSPEGNQEWVSKYDPKYCWDLVTINTDEENNVYVTGWGPYIGTGRNPFVTIKYDSEGEIKHIKRSKISKTITVLPEAFEVDKQRNVYVAGVDWDSPGHHHYYTIKYTHR